MSGPPFFPPSAVTVDPMCEPDTYAARIGERLAAESRRLCAEWLDEIAPGLPVEPGEVFPEKSLLDQLPVLLTAIGASLVEPRRQPFTASAEVLEKVRLLGELRHAQGLSLHQILREYQALWRILIRFVESETRRLDLVPDFAGTRRVLGRLHDAMELLVRFTVDAYVERLTTTLHEQRQRLLGFNETITHELRNPMHTMRLAVEVLDAEDVAEPPPSQTRALETVRNSLKRMNDTLNRLQEISHGPGPEAMSSSPRAREVELAAVIDEVRRWLVALAAERSVELRCSPDPARARIHEGKLLTALLNVVSNAVLYSDPDKSERFVEISARASEDDLVVQVRDNGIGIPPEDLSRVQERSFRSNREHARQHGLEGDGVGLALTRECVDEMNGTLRIDSQPGSGTTVVMTFPGACEAASGSEP